MLGCAPVVTVDAVPVTDPAIGLVTVKPPNVPTDVIAVCAAVVNVPATDVKSPVAPDMLPVVTLPA